MRVRDNPELRGVMAGGGLVAAGLLLGIVPLAAGMDGMSGGYALATFGLLLVIAGLVTAAIFGSRAARLQTILSGRDVLAHWSYAQEVVDRQAERDRRALSARNRALFLVVAGWMAVFVALFVVIGLLEGEEDALPLFLAIMAGVLLVVALFAFGMPYWLARRARRSRRQAIIARNGLYLNGAFHPWNAPMSALDGVQPVEDEQGARLAFHLRARTTPGLRWAAYIVEVPVPPGEEETARRVAAGLRS